MKQAGTSGSSVADRRERVAEETTQADERRRGVPALAATTDEAIRTAAKVAIDAGDVERARALIDLLDVKAPIARVVPLALSKRSPR